MIPTAEEFLKKETQTFHSTWRTRDSTIQALLKRFSKMHVEAAKEQFKIVFSEISDPYPFEYNDSLEDVYPLTNIK